MNVFGKRLKELRKERSLTQEDLRELFTDKNGLSVTNQTISYYESGKYEPNFKGLLAISEYFEVSIDYLLGRSEYRNAEDKIFISSGMKKLNEFPELKNLIIVAYKHAINDIDFIDMLKLIGEKLSKEQENNINFLLNQNKLLYKPEMIRTILMSWIKKAFDDFFQTIDYTAITDNVVKDIKKIINEAIVGELYEKDGE